MSAKSYIKMTHGVLALKESGRGELPVLLIHGNSSCSDVFRKQRDAGQFSDYRLIAVDLPGHGQSEDATDAVRNHICLAGGGSLYKQGFRLRESVPEKALEAARV